MAPRASCSLLESKSASRPGRQQPPLPAGKFLRCGRIKFSHAIQRIRAESHPLPAQQPPDTGHGALDPLDEVVAGIQLEHRVDPLSQKVGMDRLCVLLNGFQDRIAGLGLPVPREKYMQSAQRFGSWEKTYSLKPGNHREPDMHPTRENTSVWQMAYKANSPAREYPAIPRHAGGPGSSFSASGMISSTSSRR